MVTSDAKGYITIKFNWVLVSPDKRQWKPSTPNLVPVDIQIAVYIPLDKEHIYNIERVITSQLTNQDLEQPILTPKGMRYAIDQLETAMSDEKAPNEFDEEKDFEEDWS